ncbi:MAG TPA: undecaprenyl-diphosphatase UppP [Bryobacteraceae bacterium]|nr:undecaprenyl-diphosphatase UppP [Bryobacteraceae bacterium]
MSLLQVIVLGVVQGFTEFLPVSSTAHLYLTSWLLGWQAESLDFDIMLHLGTLIAVLLYFFRDWIQIVAQAFGLHFDHDRELKHNPGLLWLLVVGSIPVGVAGALFNKRAETVWRTPVVMGVMLIAVGIVIWLAENAGRRLRDLASLNFPDTVTIGVAQALAVVPGCSRSGITIASGLFRDLTRESAARFSFLLSTPAIAGAAAKALWDVHKHGGGLASLLTAPFAVGVAVSGLTGCLVIAWFLQYLRHSSLRVFVYYRIIFGIIVLALAFIRRPA